MLIRYPGAKDKHYKFLSLHIPSVSAIAEPFAGTAAMTFKLLSEREEIKQVWLNDMDFGIAAMLITIRDNPKLLINKIKRYIPKAEDFYRFRKEPEGETTVDTAFRKIVLHQISYSGMGMTSGSPIGGRNQTGNWLVGCRWSSETLTKNILKMHELMQSRTVKITHGDWSKVVASKNHYLYLDPPYYQQGSGLYMHGDIDHAALAKVLKARGGWTLSYDNHPIIMDFYRHRSINIVPVEVRSFLKTGRKLGNGFITDLIITKGIKRGERF